MEILKSFAFGLFFGLAKLSLKSHEKHEDENTVSAPSKILSEQDISEVIEMALSDHVSFSDIRNLHGLREAEVKLLMRKSLKPAATEPGAKVCMILAAGAQITNENAEKI